MRGNKRDWRRAGWKILQGLLFVSAGMYVTEFLADRGMLAGLSRTLLDSLPLTLSSTPSIHVIIVTINDDDYASLFGKSSPLDSHQVITLLRAIQKFSPRAIGID